MPVTRVPRRAAAIAALPLPVATSRTLDPARRSAKTRSQAASGRIVSDAKRVIEKNPEVILGSWCGKKFRPERVASRPGWDAIAAVRENQLFEIKSADILQPGPAALTDGVRQIHEILRRSSGRASGTRSRAAG